MDAFPRDSRSSHFLIRQFTEILAGLVLAGVVMLSLAPFDFWTPVAGPHRELFSIGTSEVTLPDAIGNVALYVAVGFLMHLVLRKRLTPRGVGVFATLGACAALSLAMEWAQVWSPSRVSSLIDVVANLVGAALGIGVASIVEGMMPRLVGTALHELRDRPAATALKAYAGLLLLFAAMPFTFSFDTQQLARAYKASTLVPFATPPAVRALVEDESPDPDGRRGELARWMVMKRWARWAAEAGSFLVLALGLVWLMRSDYGFSTGAAAALVCWLGGLWALFLSLVQLTIASRALDATDILFRWEGLVAGLVLARRWRILGCREVARMNGFDASKAARIGAAFCGLYIVYSGLLPLAFHFDGATLQAATSSRSVLPFAAYAAARFDVLWADLVGKIAAYAVFAALLVAGWGRKTTQANRSIIRSTLSVCVGGSFGIEAAQLFLPVRVSSLTDPLLAVMGCLLGAAAVRTAESLVHFANTHEVIEPMQRVAGPLRPPMGPADRLIASLADPDPNAPTEASSRETSRQS